jgi:putative DNA primase/helicase
MELLEDELEDKEDDIPVWVGSDKKVNEVLYCMSFLDKHTMKCIGKRFFTVDGLVDDEESIKAMMFEDFQPHIHRDIAKMVKNAFEALKLMAYAPQLKPQTDRLHVANGTLMLTGDTGFGQLNPEKEFCLNRLNVAYNPEAPPPETWLRFVEELLEPGDILTLQEFMGYCLIPSNKAQKMLIIVGKGGEGKSRIGLVMQEILGDNMNTTSIQKVETNRFARADLEYKLLMVDDDMVMKALPQTSYIKTMVTNEGKMDIESKGKQSVQRHLYVRFMCFGNGSLSSLYDKSQGFYRRQIIL